MIELLKAIPRGESEYVFHGREGNPLKQVGPFARLCKRCGIENFHFHDLRHPSASEYLGHASLSMTPKYLHLSHEFQKAEVDRLNGVFRKPGQKMNLDVDMVAGNA